MPRIKFVLNRFLNQWKWICLAVLFSGLTHSSANLLVNPSFESPVSPGDGNGWDRRGPTTITLTQVSNPVVQGASALEVDGRTSAVWNGIRQDLTSILTPGRLYRIKGHVRMAQGEAPDTIRIKLLTTTGGVEKLLVELSAVTDSEYVEFSADFEFAEEDTYLSVNGPAVNAAFLLDYFTLTELPNILVNPGFEDTINPTDGSGWDRRGDATLSQPASPVVTGASSVLVESRTQTWNGIQQDLLGILLPSTTYRITGHVRLATGETDTNIQIQLLKNDGSGNTFTQLTTVASTDSEYRDFSAEFSFTETSLTDLKLAINSPSGGSLASFYLDSFNLIEPNPVVPLDSLAPDTFVFRSSGSSAGSGAWTLDGPGYIGSFLNNLGSEDSEVTLSLDVTGIDYLAVSPVLEVFTGVTREQRTVSGAATENYTFTLPPGVHTLRLSLMNPELGPARSITLNSITVSGIDVVFDNVESHTLQAAENSFEYYRKNAFSLILHDADGQRLVPGTPVTITPLETSLNFGVGVKGWNSSAGQAAKRDWVDPTHPDYADLQPIRDFLAQNFNTIVTNNAGKWAPVENVRDLLDYDVLDLIQGFASTNNLRLRMHALAWAKSGGNPGWAVDLMDEGIGGNVASANALRSEISERITDYITGRATDWIEMDGINEGWHVDGLLQLYGYAGVADIYEEAYDELRLIGSTTPIYFNEYGTFSSTANDYASWFVDHIQNVLANIPESKRLDGFGIGHQSYVSNKPGQNSFLDPIVYYKVLQNTASMGLPLSITEFGVKQEPAPVPTYMESAELLRQAMTIALGNDRVNSFLVWNFLEGEMFTNATAAPMLLDDGNFNYTLTDFGRAWQHMTGRVDHSSLFPGYPVFMETLEETVGADGMVQVRGIPGKYRISGDNFQYDVDLDQAGEFVVNGPPVRNVLMIIVDDLKPTIGAFGDPIAVTPRMDQLADQGVIFSNAHCQMAICGPSRASVLTGLRPDSTGVFDLNTLVRDVNPEIVTLPQHFSDHGYTTHGISKIFHGTNSAGQDVALSWNDGWEAHGVTKKFYEPGKSEFEDALRSSGNGSVAGRVSSTDRGIVSADTDYGDGMAAQKGVDKIAEYAPEFINNGTPFFLTVGFQKPHLPFNAPDQYWALYDGVDFGMGSYNALFDYPVGAPTYARPFSGEPGSYEVQGQIPDETYGAGWPAGDEGVVLAPDASEATRLVHGYYACASFIDAQIGRLLDELEAQGIADDTIVVLWSDHGFHLGDHGAFWAKHSNYEQSTRSVLMVKAPGVTEAGGVVTSPVELVDIFPTLCQLTGLAYPVQPNVGPLEGNGLEPVLRDSNRPWRKAAFSQYHRNPGSLYMGYSMRTDQYRLTSWFPRGSLIDASTTGSTPVDEEFYDYGNAPDEPVNLIGDSAYALQVAAFRPVMEGARWEDSIIAQYVGDPVQVTPIANWKSVYFPLGTESALLADNLDYDGDGLPTSVEYFLGLSPVVWDDKPLSFGASNGGGSLEITLGYPSPVIRPDYTGYPEKSFDLSTWSTSGLTINNNTETGRTDATLNTTEAKGFIRLNVQANP
ncbi:sulfatase-like hydrolase/transferase [Puniceicoccales bacterium CK1056]|uniref:Sulfatase-like hydrolase/transferase n=1 Tax=Oceanipulchritudo coccoides TaxID=2706888 RepID=A0A6B2M250_9BACT|nr:sulfatase-like hydrolase/transferase [Oceanipulchritudo coccoides]NDV61875.1 sulfatase-like hydrolase/transferase [Oceanipulchritudo coccoides]